MNNIGAQGAMMISEALKTNTTLTKLDLRGDEICNCKIKLSCCSIYDIVNRSKKKKTVEMFSRKREFHE